MRANLLPEVKKKSKCKFFERQYNIIELNINTLKSNFEI